MTWTPQQDLEEESSSDDLESPMNSAKNTVPNIPGAKFSPRGQLFMPRDSSFSMSLPRADRMYLNPESLESKVRGLFQAGIIFIRINRTYLIFLFRRDITQIYRSDSTVYKSLK